MDKNTEKPFDAKDVVFSGGEFEKEKLTNIFRKMVEKDPHVFKELFESGQEKVEFIPIPDHVRRKIQARRELLRPSDPEVFSNEMARRPQPLTQVLAHYGFESDGDKPIYHREDGACVIVHASSIEDMDKIYIARLLMMPNSSVEISTSKQPLTIGTLLVDGILSINTDKPFACHYLKSSGHTAITDFSNAEGSDPNNLSIYLGDTRDSDAEMKIINPYVFNEEGEHYILQLDDGRYDVLSPSCQNYYPQFWSIGKP